MSSAVETIEIDLQGAVWTLQIKPWPYKVGRRWLTRLVRALGSVSGGAQTGDIGAQELLGAISETMLDELVEECEGQTVCVGPDKKAVAFAKLSPLLSGRYDVTLRIVVTHLKVTFGPFFASLGPVLSDLGVGEIRAGGI